MKNYSYNKFNNYNKRDINGIILIDKPIGISSNKLLQKVKLMFKASKAGHTGSLDILASGMLPICFGEATKFSQYLLNADKSYLVTAKLGISTDTSDSEGKKISIRPVFLNQKKLENALNCFKGRINQIPSMFSALKYNGKPLYKYARQGITLQRNIRTVYVYSIDLHYWDFTKIKLKIHCSKGTYIRSIVHDLGELLGCGAHVIKLRRLNVGNYSSTKMITFTSLKNINNNKNNTIGKYSTYSIDKFILPIESALQNIPVINLPDDMVIRMQFGQTIFFNTSLKTGLVLLNKEKTNCFFGIGEIIKPNIISPRRLILNKYIY